jgi:hypothetical protein
MYAIRFIRHRGECEVTSGIGEIEIEYHEIPILHRDAPAYKKMSYRCQNSGRCPIISRGDECPIYKQAPSCIS